MHKLRATFFRKSGLRLVFLLAVCGVLVLAGCGGSSTPPSNGGSNVSGTVDGGLVAIANATVSLFHYSGGRSSLVNSVTADASGSFAFPDSSGLSSTGFYYVVATGGTTGGNSVPAGTVLLGLVNATAPNDTVINELSTVALNDAIANAVSSANMASIRSSAFSNSAGFNFSSDIVNTSTLAADYSSMFNNSATRPGIRSSSVTHDAQENMVTEADALAGCVQDSGNCPALGVSASASIEATILTMIQEVNNRTLSTMPQSMITVAGSYSLFADAGGSTTNSMITNASMAPGMNSPMMGNSGK